jgi:arylsulfatase A-like enzyme/Flp pilus assembly protein TadD
LRAHASSLVLRSTLVAAAVTAVVCAACGRDAPPAIENLLLITLDTTRADKLGCYGDATAKTPHIDAVAARGARFDNAYTAVPLTLPAHATILTGTYPTHHRIRYNGTSALHPDAVTLAEKLGPAGFATGAVIGGYVLHHQFGLDQGFDAYLDGFSGNDRPAREVTDDAIRFLDEHPDRRFFLWVHYFDPHAPYQPPAEYAALGRYEGEVAYMDAEIGRLLDELERRGRRETTAIAIVADHGEALGQHEPEHRIFLYEPTMRVPLVLDAPGRTEPGSAVAELVATVDLFPTLCELAGVDPGGNVQGRSLLRTAAGETGGEREAYLETHGPRQMFGWSELVGLRRGPWKYIRAPREELYDVAADPGEMTNLARNEPEVATELSSRLDELVETTSAGGQEAATELTEDARRKLESLGYISGGGGADDAEAIDPKDRADAIFRHHELAALRKHDAAAALAGYRELASTHPDDLMAQRAIGAILIELGRLDEAVPVFEGLLEHRPDGVVALRTLAFLYMRQGRLEDALNLADTAVSLNEQSSQSLLIRSIVLATMGRHDDALATVERALAHDPEHDAALLQRGELLMRAGRWEEAAATLEAISASDPNRYEGLRLLDHALARAGQDARRTGVQAEIEGLKSAGRARSRRIDFFGGGY